MSAVSLDILEELDKQPVTPKVQISLNVRGLGQSSTPAINERSARVARRYGL